jgi:N-acetylmuramoyl-L-alanine amidase
MTFSLQSSLGLIFAALIVSCAAPDNRSSLGRDVYGHRPGPQGFRTVIIDAGHGGKDSGAVSAHTGQKEKDLALDTAKRIANELRGEFKVILMRSDDSFIDLDERVIRANRHGDAILISMHYNSGPSAIRGPETYYWRVDSHGLATRFQQAMAAARPAESGNRGLVRRRIRLTRNPEIPCVLLEGGYLSNAAEARLISNPGYRQKLASNIAAAIRTQAAVGDRGTGPLPHPINAPPSRPTDAPE